MGEFRELIKKFDKIRSYMRDFYVYGFKSRNDFNGKSARTYDNEKRRIESYMGKYMHWEYSGRNKTVFISVDCANIPVNPLYSAWKSKSFTQNDIMLHFFIFDSLSSGSMDVDALADNILAKSGLIFEIQTIRNKCNEYVKLGLLKRCKNGKAFEYTLPKNTLIMSSGLADAVCFFQGAVPFGVAGSYIMDNENLKNDIFRFKNQYIAHTLEDGILLSLLEAIQNGRTVFLQNKSLKTGKTNTVRAVPLKIFISTVTGRRYVCIYSFKKRQFYNCRLDYIESVSDIGESQGNTGELKEKLEKSLDKVWGVNFGGKDEPEKIKITFKINEKSEQYILTRLRRESQGGTIEKIDDNKFVFKKEIYDSSDMSPWIKTFIGRIIALEGTNKMIINRFYNDINRMAGIYGITSDHQEVM